LLSFYFLHHILLVYSIVNAHSYTTKLNYHAVISQYKQKSASNNHKSYDSGLNSVSVASTFGTP